MRIRTLLVWGTASSGAVVAVVIGYLAVAARTLDASLTQDGAARTLVASLFEQSEVLSDFILHPGERARSQWLTKHAEIGHILGRLARTAGGEEPLLARIQEEQRKSGEHFLGLIEALEGEKDEMPRAGALNELQEHRVTQLRVATQTMRALSSGLGRQAEESLLRTHHELAWGIGVLLASMAALLAGVWFIVGWRVVRPVVRLRQSIANFSGGKVGPWDGIRADDEIGDVAHAFEQMAENLNSVMVSRDDLSKEVETRRRAERKAQEFAESLKARTSELDAVNKELETFAYSVSHDLRAPLRSMAGFCQALVEDYGEKLDDTGKDYVQRVSAASKRMGQLIDDLLMLSRVTRTEIRRAEVDLSELAKTIAAQLREAEPHRAVEFRIQPAVTVRGDEALLRTVLENLLGNAWKYSSKKPQATIEFGVAANGAEPTYYVRDDGVGFDMAHADKLFQPFQRLHRASEFEGTGIGLVSAANIVRRHGGRVWADSAPGAGTTMRFTLSQ